MTTGLIAEKPRHLYGRPPIWSTRERHSRRCWTARPTVDPNGEFSGPSMVAHISRRLQSISSISTAAAPSLVKTSSIGEMTTHLVRAQTLKTEKSWSTKDSTSSERAGEDYEQRYRAPWMMPDE
jgi:hypothetical protein